MNTKVNIMKLYNDIYFVLYNNVKIKNFIKYTFIPKMY